MMRAYCLFIVLLLSFNANASQQLLNSFFKNVTTLEAIFEQRIIDETGVLIELSSGRFYLSRPGKFRWSYLPSDSGAEIGQQIIADGTSIFMFDPDLEQVTQRSMKDALSQVPSLLLVQNGTNIDKHFLINDIGLTDGISWVGLKPRDEDAGYQQLMIGFLDKQLSSIVLVDGLGNETRLRLADVKVNQRLPSSTFDFTVPDGADLLVE